MRTLACVVCVMAAIVPVGPPGLDDCVPVRAVGFPAVVCLHQEAVGFVLRNGGDRDLWVSVAVEGQGADRSWVERCADVFHASTTKQLVAVRLKAHVELPVTWRVGETCSYLPLTPGIYRLLATVAEGAGKPKNHFVLAYFEARAQPCCPR